MQYCILCILCNWPVEVLSRDPGEQNRIFVAHVSNMRPLRFSTTVFVVEKLLHAASALLSRKVKVLTEAIENKAKRNV